MAATAAGKSEKKCVCVTCLLIFLASALLIQTTGADFCFRKYSSERDACKGQIQSHSVIDADACCAASGTVRGQGYAKQLLKHPTKNGKKWFKCVPCSSLAAPTPSISRPAVAVVDTATNVAIKRDKYVEEEVDSKLLSFQTNGIVQIDGVDFETQKPSADSRGVTAAKVPNVEMSNDLLNGASLLRKNEIKIHRPTASRRPRQKNSVKQHQAKDRLSPSTAAPKNLIVETVWSSWSEWGPCSETCGLAGKQQRTRFCLTGNCQDEADFEERLCIDVQQCPVDGGWGKWSDWSVCNATCNSHDAGSASVERQRRTRACDSPTPAHGGADCVGSYEEFRPCEELPLCPVNGGWSEWTNWTMCSTSCGEGLQTRSRQCDNPVPQHGGRPCEGLELESAPCIMRPDCPVNGAWSDWSRMEYCSARPCSGQRGFRTKFRSCTDPRPSLGGMPCRGRSWIREPCYNNDFCTDRVDGDWCIWSEWTTCDDSVGFKTRERNCSCPPPANGGSVCQGDSTEKKTCRTIKPTPILPKVVGGRTNGCHGDGSGDGSDIECDMEQEDEGSTME